jgi:arylsulfatase A-like enzyme
MHTPGMKTGGQRSDSLIELLDVYPTLCDLCGVPAPKHLQGQSLRPLLNDPSASIHDHAFTQARRGKNAEFWGRTVRTARWRCTEWDEGKNGLELYDHDNDPHEYINLANNPKRAATLKELRQVLADKLPPISQ